MSPLTLEFKVYYREMDQKSGPWTGVRVRRLCKMLQLTTEELAAYIRVPHFRFEQFLKEEQFPPALKLLLELVERSAFRTYLGQYYDQPLFPQLAPVSQ